MGYFIWLILSRKSIFGHTIKILEPGRSSTDQSAFIASEFELRQKIENRCRRLIKKSGISHLNMAGILDSDFMVKFIAEK